MPGHPPRGARRRAPGRARAGAPAGAGLSNDPGRPRPARGALPGLEPRGRRGGPRRRPRSSRPLRGAAGCQRASCPCWLRCDRVVVRGGRSGVSREPRRPGPSGGGGASRAIAGLRPPCQPSPRGDPRAARAAPDCRSLDATPCGGIGPGQGEGVAGRPASSGQPMRSSSSPAQGARPRRGRASRPWARRLRDRGLPVIALAGPADGPVVDSLLVSGAVAENALARDWSLREIAALLSLVRATVGNDSGPSHLAAAVGCPTVAVFGPTDPAVWAPVGPHVRVVAGRPGTAPWAGVDVGRVEAALQHLLDGPGAPAPPEPVRVVTGRACP